MSAADDTTDPMDEELLIDLPADNFQRDQSEWLIDWRCKSFPPSAEGVPAARVAEQHWRVHDHFATPVAMLKQSALTHNVTRMREYCAEHEVTIAPHGKTTMSPELVTMQLDHGAWGMTVATAWQARMMLEFGARRILIANECVDPVGLRWIAGYLCEHPEVEVLCFADSVAVVAQMRAVLREFDESSGDDHSGSARAVPVLVEVGVAGGRAGARDVAGAVEVGQAVAAAPELALVGVGGFEGVIGGRRVPDVVEPVRQFLSAIRRVAEELMAAQAFAQDRPVILSAGGSAFFDQVVDVFTTGRDRYPRPVEVVIRSGCYLTHDHVTYRASSPFAGDDRDFRPAIEVWARVISTPEPGLAIIDAGKRDISTDVQMPVVLARLRGTEISAVEGVTVERFNDQHGYLKITPAGRNEVLRVGDRVSLGISHPCTTFDKWRVIPVVDDGYAVTSAIRTYF